VAVGLATGIEGNLEPDLKVPFAADLWASGVIEETSKILVPVLFHDVQAWLHTLIRSINSLQ